MIRLILAIWFALAGVAMATPVLVKTGEHDGFTRLVLEYRGAVDWQLGRSDDGYDLAIAKATPSYDLTEAFKLIGTSRLAGISTDPENGNLHLSIACACYAIPFEFRPGIVVIDLRDGTPPKGSSFEHPLTQTLAPKTAAKLTTTPWSATSGYNWTVEAVTQLRGNRLIQSPPADTALQPLRNTLLHQLSRGAAEGVVEMAKLRPGSGPILTRPNDSFDSARVGLGELPGVAVSNGLSDHQNIGAQGQRCIESQRLDVASWGDGTPVLAQMAMSNSSLIGEFDKPDAAALQRAVQFRLSIGFGVEALQLLQAFPTDLADRAIWKSMAKLVDGRPDLGSVFLGQQSCDTSAALWAVLAQPDLRPDQYANTDAAFLAFSALPIGLRRDLGPTLADRFIAIGADRTATRVRDAILRAPGGAGPDATLLTATLDMRTGDPAAAEAVLQRMISDPGPGTPDAIVALVEARVAQDLPVAPDMVAAVQAIVREQIGAGAEPAALRALLLATAASGDIDAAFSLLPKAPDAEPKLWRVLSLLGTDDAVLAHAVLTPNASLPHIEPQTAAKLAERLLLLGMADSALKWLPDAAHFDPILLARVHLQRHDARAALRALTGQSTKQAVMLRAQAMLQLGENDAAAQIYAEAGAAPSELRALGKAENWAEIGKHGADPWKQVAAELAPLPSSNTETARVEGPLAQGKRLVENSAATRSAVDKLIAKIAQP
ncbi:MAG: hypothetical protein JWS10_1942 [Cypionkella sp.]|uniref:hypothetical protein n=1 Tax=Cypionkella sp. TaxID=2811411 RepID=UPI00263A05BD|nr:hypothetical protein [Cypionkella sp.]MDB5659327.1 hypothetical protein [Cypionkella sp.]